jgi:hypothetical protein
MSPILKRKFLLVLLLPVFFGCTTIALMGAGAGTNYTLSNVAYRTFSISVNQVYRATIAALKKMDIQISDDIKSKDGRTITAATKELEIFIKLEAVTQNTTKLKVDARKNIVLKDKATAAEIINQVGKNLGE